MQEGSKMSFKKQLSGRIKSLRTDKNLTAEALAWNGGLSKSGLSDIETCRKDAKVITVKKICKGLGISLAEFFSVFNEIDNND